MTSTQSANKRANPTFIWFKQQLSKSLVFGILLLVLMCFTMLIGIQDMLTCAYSKDAMISLADQATTLAYNYTSILFLCGLLVIGILTKNFRHLYKKSIADTVYALPISNNQRFIGSLLASLVLIIAPMLLSILFAVLYHQSASGAEIYYEAMLKNSKIENSEFIWLYVNLTMAQLANLLFLFGTALFVFCCCGELFDSVVYTGVFGALAFVLYSVFYAVSDSAVGNYCWLDNDIPAILNYLSPFSSTFMYSYTMILLGTDSNGVYASVDEMSLAKDEFVKYYLIIFAIAIMLMAFSFVLHSNRKSEHVGKPFAYKMFYYIVSSLALLVAGVAIYASYLSTKSVYDHTYYYGAMIGTFMFAFFAFLVCEVIAERKKRPSLKRIIQGAVRFVCVTVVGIVISAIISTVTIKNTYDSEISSSDVEAVSVNINADEYGFDYTYDEYGFPEYKNDILVTPLVRDSIVFDGEKEIEMFVELCNQYNGMIYENYKKDGYGTLIQDIWYAHNYGNQTYKDGDLIFYDLSIAIIYKDGTRIDYSYNDTIDESVNEKMIELLSDDELVDKGVSYSEYFDYRYY